MILYVILLSMLMILLPALSVIRLLICDNSLIWLHNFDETLETLNWESKLLVSWLRNSMDYCQWWRKSRGAEAPGLSCNRPMVHNPSPDLLMDQNLVLVTNRACLVRICISIFFDHRILLLSA